MYKNDNKYGFNLESIEERTLYRALNNMVRIDNVDETNVNNHYKASLSPFSSHTLKQKRFEKVLINIDNVLIEFETRDNYNTGHLQYYVYPNKIGGRHYMNLYIPVDYVLNGEIFYTTTKEERRTYKIKHLISNIKIKN